MAYQARFFKYLGYRIEVPNRVTPEIALRKNYPRKAMIKPDRRKSDPGVEYRPSERIERVRCRYTERLYSPLSIQVMLGTQSVVYNLQSTADQDSISF